MYGYVVTYMVTCVVTCSSIREFRSI